MSAKSPDTPVEQSAIAIEQPANFEWFPKLPKELQIKIWKYAELNNPRQVRVNITLRGLPENSNPIIFYFKLLSPLPPTLYTCHESRTESLKRYFPCIKARRTGERVAKERSDAPLYVNPVTDTLVLEFGGWFINDGIYVVEGLSSWIGTRLSRGGSGLWRFTGNAARAGNIITIGRKASTDKEISPSTSQDDPARDSVAHNIIKWDRMWEVIHRLIEIIEWLGGRPGQE